MIHLTDDQLYDALDGTLEPGEEAALSAHLEQCPSCQARREAIQAVLKATQALPASLEPPRDLWAGIEARIQPGGKVIRPVFGGLSRRQVLGWGTALAAAAVYLLSIGLRSSPPDPRLETPEAVAIAPSSTPVGQGTLTPDARAQAAAELQALIAPYEEATRKLSEALAARRSELSPETLLVVEKNLRTIDEAIAETRQALEKEGQRGASSRMLVSMYESKVKVLKLVVGLPRHT